MNIEHGDGSKPTMIYDGSTYFEAIHVYFTAMSVSLGRCQAGLLLPKSQKPKQGEVVAAGPGEASVESGQMVPMSVKVGEKAGSCFASARHKRSDPEPRAML